MKQLWLTALLFTSLTAGAQELNYYLPKDISYSASIPKPRDIIYHEVGEWHITHDRLVNYMKAIAAAAPDRVKLVTMGLSYEARPQVLLIITSKKNHENLEQIRQQHVQLTDPSKSGSLNIDNMPAVVWIGHSIHGNEPSGANAALLTAYHLAAAQGKQIEEILDNVVILFDPSFNPDGLQRFSTWVNQHKSKNLVTDPNSREFSEVWPGGRFNHYWFDLNRDWLPAVHVESQNRLQYFQDWKPNILTDHHEQGSNATFFFQPGVPSRVNPLTPEKNQELTGKIASYHAKALDKIGSLYFTKENYDDFYYGKGSTYPDVQGCIGILFEQASSRGHAQQTANGVLKFPFTIRNQFTTALSTLEAAVALRKELLSYQRDYFKMTAQEGSNAISKAWVIGDNNDQARTNIFIEMLLRHKIEVYELGSNLAADGQQFEKGKAYVIPSAQPQYRLLRGIFDKTLTYKDSLFYDITAWTMPLAYGLPYAELNAAKFTPAIKGAKVEQAKALRGEMVGAATNLAYIFEWDEMYAPKMLYELMENGISAKVATRPFEAVTANGNKTFDYGSIVVQVPLQKTEGEKLFNTIKAAAEKNGVRVYSLSSGMSASGVDLGSSKFTGVGKPTIAMLVGTGVSPLDAGEIWHMLDQRFNIPLTHLEIGTFNRVELNKYNTILMVSGNYNELNKDKLKTWVQNGGTLICFEDALQWCAQNGISSMSFRKVPSAVDSTASLTYAGKDEKDGAQQNNGAIFRASMDLTHPLAYGYNQPYVDLFKAGKNFPEKSKNPYATPFAYGEKPLQSGYISKENYAAIKNSAAVIVNTVGSGRVISIADNPNFRAFWLGGNKLLMNAIFFGRNIDPGSGRTE
ncbi:M14 family metallopeptidase [Flavihumibacter rivuli]|uniref:M14 metallopeptidase family protein n=1 Tax=Flavihumibacter rivuli TaxID=2838156 RepID=UPI001BDE6E11|nr:M14 metallopeptidase family protein [Flavihumibacter rivuli]ULQ57238.1 M14 family metallopeptidase [Flavihumibacter rivuli]